MEKVFILLAFRHFGKQVIDVWRRGKHLHKEKEMFQKLVQTFAAPNCWVDRKGGMGLSQPQLLELSCLLTHQTLF